MPRSKAQKKDATAAEEIGRWYDDHSATEVESEEVELKVERKYDPTFTMRIPEDALRRLKNLADARGVPASTLARMLLLEALGQTADPARGAMELLAAVVEHEVLREVLRVLVTEEGPEGLRKARVLLQEASGAGLPVVCEHVGKGGRTYPIPHAKDQAVLQVVKP